MSRQASSDPYAGNILIDPLGPILAPTEVLKRLTMLPPLPPDPLVVPKYVRLYHLMAVRDFHLPSREELRTQQTIDTSIREGLRYRNPASAKTWMAIAGEAHALNDRTPRASAPRMPPIGGAAVGPSGVGKTEAVLRACDCMYGSQVILHRSFPRLTGQHVQVVWLSVDVPGSGRTDDLAETLMRAWDELLLRCVPDYRPRFEHTLSLRARKGARMLTEWRHVASSHYLGMLHLDEIQNLFKIASLKKRRSAKSSNDSIELSLVEDESLKWILTLTNTWQIPLFLTGTPDGIGALTKRLATSQRIVSAGFHKFDPFPSATDGSYVTFMTVLGRYQYTRVAIDVMTVLDKVFEATAGIRRLIIALWVGAHRIALERKDDELKLGDFEEAARTLMAPVGPSVRALLSGRPDALQRYEDLRPGEEFWETYWSNIQTELPDEQPA